MITYPAIVLFVYNRPKHTLKTLETLKNNIGSENYDLFIFSDGPKTLADENKISEVRDTLKTAEGFRSVRITESSENKGLAESVIGGVSKVLEIYESVIVLEDDIITSKHFLNYMSAGLSLFKNAGNIYSISGYSFPLKTETVSDENIYLLPRPSSWGWGTWREKWSTADWEIKDYKAFLKSNVAIRKFNSGGDDLTPMLINQMSGKIDSWAVRWAFHHYKNNAYCVYPRYSLAANTGNDNSGVHSDNTDKFSCPVTDFPIIPITIPKANRNMELALKEFFKPSVIRRIINRIKLIRERYS